MSDIVRFETNLLKGGAVPKQDIVLCSPTTPLPVALYAPMAGVAATVVEGFKAPAAIATPEALTATSTLVSQVTLFAQKTGRTGANTSIIYWGWTAANDAQLNPIAIGGSITITAPPGKLIDLASLYIDSLTVTDGVRWVSMV